MMTRNFSLDRPRWSSACPAPTPGVEALADVAVHLALVHQLEGLQHVVRLVELGQVVEGPVVFPVAASPHQAFIRLTRNFLVAVVAELIRTQRLGRALGDIGIPVLLGLAGSVR
jgi:hypothetical protein